MFYMRLFVVIVFMKYVQTERKNITIGTIVNEYLSLPFAIYRSGPAIELGIENLKEILSEEADINIKLKVAERNCVADTAGASAAEMFYVDKVSAFIGPGKYAYTSNAPGKYTLTY
jgi:hypothetical protein